MCYKETNEYKLYALSHEINMVFEKGFRIHVMHCNVININMPQ